jgi:alkanesulfonate monooxygenase SsuD/methylene tetrahydromethanopterin reductase-like flavin-dependent oxidoreductase (luciferase family)
MNDSDDTAARRLRRYWFSSVQQVSDLALQRRTWLDPTNRNPHWSYVEFASSYPDSSQLAGAYADGWLTASEFGILSELGRAIDAHSAPKGNNYDHAAILKDPAWHVVVEAAERARLQLLTTITDHSERQMLLGCS